MHSKKKDNYSTSIQHILLICKEVKVFINEIKLQEFIMK